MKNKKTLIISIIGILLLTVGIVFLVLNNKTSVNNKSQLKELPKPEITGGSRGELGIDKNINEKTIDEYLNREDSVYRDMRMLEDPGNYEAIGGDRYLSSYLDGFEVIPLPYIIPVTGLPEAVGETYTGTTLFYEQNGTYIANYEESMSIIEKIFPKDKVIFLMCGGGGYAGMTKNFLVSMGWDENKIYNTGGFWYYEGKHSINVKKEKDGVVSYDFDKVPYHNIDFTKLTKATNYKNPDVKVEELKISTSSLSIEEGASFQLSVIVLPNAATNKEIKWSSSNENVAVVTEYGLVKAVGNGETTIKAKSVDGNKTITCKVTVKKKQISTRVKIDDVSKESEEMDKYSLITLNAEFYNKTEMKVDENGNLIQNEYHDLAPDGEGYVVNDLYRQEYAKHEKKVEEYKNMRLKIFNKLLEDKKSFIILIHTKECEERDYRVVDGAEKLLNQNGYSFINIGHVALDGDTTLEYSNLDISNLGSGSVAIIKEGKLYAGIDLNILSIKNEEELRSWLSKYIEI